MFRFVHELCIHMHIHVYMRISAHARIYSTSKDLRNSYAVGRVNRPFLTCVYLLRYKPVCCTNMYTYVSVYECVCVGTCICIHTIHVHGLQRLNHRHAIYRRQMIYSKYTATKCILEPHHRKESVRVSRGFSLSLSLSPSLTTNSNKLARVYMTIVSHARAQSMQSRTTTSLSLSRSLPLYRVRDCVLGAACPSQSPRIKSTQAPTQLLQTSALQWLACFSWDARWQHL